MTTIIGIEIEMMIRVMIMMTVKMISNIIVFMHYIDYIQLSVKIMI